MLRHPSVLIGASDAGAHVRGFSTYGDTAVVLADFVRDGALLGLEQAVKRLTHDLAVAWNLADRGLLRPGYAADVAVFDPGDHRARTRARRCRHADRLPALSPGSVGVDATIVNGTVAWTNEGGYTPACTAPSPRHAEHPQSAGGLDDIGQLAVLGCWRTRI